MRGGMGKRIHDRSKHAREADIFLGLDVQIFKFCCRPLHLGARVCCYPFVLSEPEGPNRSVIYVGGPCKAHGQLLLADSPTQYVVLGFIFFIYWWQFPIGLQQ